MDHERVVRVAVTKRWASGFEILPRLVLTAAHAVQEVGSPVTVSKLLNGQGHAGRVVWRGMPHTENAHGPGRRNSEHVDAALVHVEGTGWQAATGQARWGRIVGERAPVKCRIWGFPRSEHSPGAVAQDFGSISPGNGFVYGKYLIDCDADRLRPLSGSPWEGVSGSAVLCGDLLTGVVTADLRGHMPTRLEAEPAVVLFQVDGFQDTLDQYGPSRARVLEPVEYGELADPDHAPVRHQSAVSLMELLDPARETVPFHGRDEQRKALEAWVRRPGPAACLIHAPGGQGKTRLALEFSRELPSEWTVLWLRPGRLNAIRTMPAPAVPLLVVIDSADSRVEEATALLEFAAGDPGARVKAVLLARSDGWWTDRVRKPSALVANLMSDALKVALPDLETDDASQRSAYLDAVRAFSEVLPGVPGRQRPWRTLADGLRLPMPGERLGSPLTLHMTALADLLDAAVTTGPSTRPTAGGSGDDVMVVENRLLEHEGEHWWRAATGHGLPLEEWRETLLDAMTAVVALGPQDRPQADALLQRVPGLADQSFNRRRAVRSWILSVLPVRGSGLIGDLQPDRLAERFIGNHLQKEPELADSLLPGATPSQAARFLTLATRASARGALSEGELGGWCVRHREVLGLPAIDVATEVEEPGPLLAALRAIVDCLDVTLPELERLAAHLPESTYNLARWGLHLNKRITEVHRAPQAGDDPERPARLAVSLRELCKRLRNMGQYDESLKAVQEAIGLWQDMPVPHPDALSELAGCHHNVALCCIDLGRRQEALEAARTAVGLLREVARTGRPTALDHLSRGLATLAEAENGLGGHEAAVRAVEECVAICHDLVRDHGARFVPLLADNLQNKAVYLLDCGRRKEALAAVQAAVGHYETLAAERPDAYRAGLALVLGTLSSASQLMGLRHQALDAARRAVAIRRKLAKERPEVYLADLANTLNHLSVDLGGLGLHDEALAAIEKSVDLFRQLARERPQAHAPRLALTLNSLANKLADAGQHARALEAAEEAVRRYRELVDRHPSAFRPELAMALVTVANSLAISERPGLERPGEALAALEEAASIYRPLAADSPAAFGPDLAICLNNISSTLRGAGQVDSALGIVEEAIALNDALVRDGSEAFAGALAKNWLVKYLCLADLDRFEEAAPAGVEAVRRLRALDRSVPGLYEDDLASALSATSVLLWAVGQYEQALDHVKEAVDIYRRLAQSEPGRYQGRLVEDLEAYGNHLFVLDRREESLGAAEEMFTQYRAMHERQATDATRLALAQAALSLGNRLMHCGRRADALPVTQEAVAALRRLHAADPAQHRPLLTGALSQTAVLLFRAGAGDAALEAAAEAVRTSRRTAAATPEAGPDRAVATARATYGALAAELGQDDALDLLEEAVGLCRRLAASTDPEDELRLAEALGHFGRHLAEVAPRHSEALRATAEAVGIYRRFAGVLPVLRADLGLLQAFHGLRLAEAGQAEKAAAVTEDAMKLARLLTAEHWAAHEEVLAHTLAAFARTRLMAGERSERAQEASAEAVALFRAIARNEPTATEPYLREARATHDRLRH